MRKLGFGAKAWNWGSRGFWQKVKVNVGQSSILAKSGTSVNGVAKDFGTKFKDERILAKVRK